MTKRATILTLALVLALGVGLAMAGEKESKAKTVEGTLVDSKCYLGGGATGNDHMGMKGCGTACAKSGIPVGVLTAEGKYFTLALPAPQLADYIGQTARATGVVKQGSIVPDKVEVKKGEKWEEVKLSAVM